MLLTPILFTAEEKEFNDKIWEKRIKYNMFDEFTENMDDAILDCNITDFQKITKHFKSPAEYAKALATMSKYIHEGKDVPQSLWTKIQGVREDFQKRVLN